MLPPPNGEANPLVVEPNPVVVFPNGVEAPNPPVPGDVVRVEPNVLLVPNPVDPKPPVELVAGNTDPKVVFLGANGEEVPVAPKEVFPEVPKVFVVAPNP